MSETRLDPPTLATVVESAIAGFLSDPDRNNLGPGHPEPAWSDFLVGYSRGDDPLYLILKEVIGDFHWSPAEAFALLSHGSAANSREAAPPAVLPDELTVISWALCQTEATKAANRAETTFPSERWVRSRVFGQAGNVALHHELLAVLAAQGYDAVAPGMSAG